MDWKSLLTKIEADVKQIKDKIYPDMTWKPESIPSRKEWNTLLNLISSMEKDCLWLEEYKNPVKKDRKMNYIELKPELEQLMKIKQRGLTCYPDRYIMMFLIHYLFSIDALNKNKIIETKLNDEFKSLFPLKDGDTVFCIQTYLKNHIVSDNNKRKMIEVSEEEKIKLEQEIKMLKTLKELKKNKQEFENLWNDFYNLRTNT